LELDQLLAQWKLWDQQVDELDTKIYQRHEESKTAALLATIPGAGTYGSLALACRIGPVERFPHARSLAHYWGLTPACRNSGDATRRLGSITKEGSALARFILAQIVLHLLRRDPRMKEWYQRIKRRRGAKIARVAVMRRLATILWHMLKRQQRYRPGGENPEASDPAGCCVLPDRNAFLEAQQGRSKGAKQKGCHDSVAAAAARP
jgi:transposase